MDDIAGDTHETQRFERPHAIARLPPRVAGRTVVAWRPIPARGARAAHGPERAVLRRATSLASGGRRGRTREDLALNRRQPQVDFSSSRLPSMNLSRYLSSEMSQR